MASKPEKRVASSVFITLAPPRRDEAVVEEVRRAACAARPARPWESPAPMKAPGAGPAGGPGPWTPSGRAAATVPAVPPQLSNGGKRLGTGWETGVEPARGWGRWAGSEIIHSSFIHRTPTVCRVDSETHLSGFESWLPHFLAV